MEIIAVKTSVGEEVVAELVSESETFYVLRRARVLVMQPQADGSVQVGMMPFLVCANNAETQSESDINLHKSFVLAAPTEVPEPLQKAYLKNVSPLALV